MYQSGLAMDRRTKVFLFPNTNEKRHKYCNYNQKKSTLISGICANVHKYIITYLNTIS